MLGSMIVDVLDRDAAFHVGATSRNQAGVAIGRRTIPSVDWMVLDASSPCLEDSLVRVVRNWDWVINAIGMIKHIIHDDHARDIEEAVRVNALFPHALARQAEAVGIRVLQIATDCVFSGARGGYNERDSHDPLDVYGKTKSLGEVASSAFHHLRCSIIGPESRGHRSLLDWFRGQPQGSVLSGFTNHHWNGVTTLHFARLCVGIMSSATPIPRLQHVIPANTVTKYELLRCFADAFGRDDIVIHPCEADARVDRSLQTRDAAANYAIWAAAGYRAPPSLSHMVNELAASAYRWRGMPCTPLA